MRPRSDIRALCTALAIAAVGWSACTSEPTYRVPPRAEKDVDKSHLETHTKFDRTSGKLVHEWTVLVSNDKPPQKHGVEKMFYTSGARQSEREFDHGKPKGAWRAWYEDGEPRSECFFGDPAVDTIMTWWYPGGQIQSRGTARNGAHRGLWRYFYKSGQVAEEGQFVENQKQGMWRAWSEDGKTVTMRRYAKGVRVGEDKAVPADAAPPAPQAAVVVQPQVAAKAPVVAPTQSPPVTKPVEPDDDERPPK
jgi:hypothetical protein